MTQKKFAIGRVIGGLVLMCWALGLAALLAQCQSPAAGAASIQRFEQILIMAHETV
jgi:hypothetical protein